jgi:hypothetical protein
MYTPIPSQATNAQAWLAAATAVQDAGGEGYNVVIDIADPVTISPTDHTILTTVDGFLRNHQNARKLAHTANISAAVRKNLPCGSKCFPDPSPTTHAFR